MRGAVGRERNGTRRWHLGHHSALPRDNGTVVEQRLYQLIRQPNPVVDRQFDIEFLDAGVETFAFTFG